ncbi:MAG: type II toxin-antitoxin system MqsA family antitoxin [SAR202 cluster bacterium]|nr:type II toxin-antitoxin system MqsA family antitoxin [SAR202 cluster bacterium]
MEEEVVITMSTCPFCKGPVQEKRIEHVHRWKGEMYILRNVPAEVCQQCGETFFTPDTLKAMDRLVSQRPRPEGHRSVPVFSL